mmetsp:Transcript_35693/g.87837  ORF Transcript_35693/g.87837 Transcript_35693/m.87837 type:complete len:385 (+) Transcript_35693:70-1224(+)
MHRFGQLLGFAQRAVVVLKKLAHTADAEWYHFDFDEEQFEGSEADVVFALAHVQRNFPERYELAVKLAVAHICEEGFHEDAEEGPYYVVNDAMQECVRHMQVTAPDYEGHVGVSDLEFSMDFVSTSSRTWMCDLLYRADCGSDEHLEELNEDNWLSTTDGFLGARLHRSLHVLPLDLDALASRLFALPPNREDVIGGETWQESMERHWRSYNPFLCYEDWVEENPDSDEEEFEDPDVASHKDGETSTDEEGEDDEDFVDGRDVFPADDYAVRAAASDALSAAADATREAAAAANAAAAADTIAAAATAAAASGGDVAAIASAARAATAAVSEGDDGGIFDGSGGSLFGRRHGGVTIRGVTTDGEEYEIVDGVYMSGGVRIELVD